MNEMIVAIDFETANSDPHSACAVGLIAYQNNQIVFEYESLIKPPKKYSEFNFFNTKIHGIERSEVADEPTWDQIYPQILPYLEGSIIVAHNAMFDLRVLRNLNEYYQIPLPSAHYFCTVELSQKWLPDLENHRLNTVSKFLQVPLDHHNAKSDAMASLAIAIKALENNGNKSVEDLLVTHELELKSL